MSLFGQIFKLSILRMANILEQYVFQTQMKKSLLIHQRIFTQKSCFKGSKEQQMAFQLGPALMPSTKKRVKRCRTGSAINEVVTKEYTINIHKCIHGVSFKKYIPRALKEIWKFAIKEMLVISLLRPELCSVLCCILSA